MDCLLDQADAENVVDVFALTNQMRKDRVNMIQTVVSICAVLLLFCFVFTVDQMFLIR